jgi:phenylalanyl-tRNA synthetase beta chain
MKFSEQWLREWVDPEITTAELVEQLTMAGLEVDSVEPAAADFSGVVVGEVITVEQHPDADKLRVCQVSDGSESNQVVCGAPNVRPGLKVAFAQLNAVLPGDFQIKKAMLRGMESCGMLCSEDELGISDSADGLMELPNEAPVGKDFRDYLQLEDKLIELDLTPNRGDCLGIAGLARETGVLNKLAVNAPLMPVVESTVDDTVTVSLQAAEHCPRYVGRVIRNINLNGKTPLWMQERLRRSGLRSIDPVVDVTNYVLLELGQPMHAFDLDKLAGEIQVRLSTSGEKLELLDGQEVELQQGTLLIADEQKPLAMAGIMGGAESAVTASTQNLFLESALFNPVSMAGKARAYGLHTDSSHRFERGVDPALQEQAIERATALLMEIVGGQPGPLIVAESRDQLPDARQVHLRRDRIFKVLGLQIADKEVEDILERLGMVLHSGEQGWQVSVPGYRFDIAIEADLMEELARIYGYNRLPISSQRSALQMKPTSEAVLSMSRVRQTLVERGYQEVVTYSFIEPELQNLFDPLDEPVPVSNPISADMSVMRTSLLPGLVTTLVYNQNRQQSRARLFEAGLRFNKGADGLQQTQSIAALLWGKSSPESWATDSLEVDFYDLKGDVEALLGLTGNLQAFSFEAGEHAALHPGQCASIKRDGVQVGHIGALHPNLLAQLGISGQVYLFEVNFAQIQQGKLPKFKELSRFPEVRRDLAIIVDEEVVAGDILACVREIAGDYLQNLKLFDVYRGKGIDSSRKSLAFALTLRHSSHTLNEEEVNAITADVVNALTDRFGATLRN